VRWVRRKRAFAELADSNFKQPAVFLRLSPPAGRGRAHLARVRGTLDRFRLADSAPHPDPLPAGGEREKKTQPRDLAAHFARVLLATSHPLQREGAGNAGRPMRPIAACAMVEVECTRVSQVTPEITRHSPRNGFNGFLRALLGDGAFLPPSPALPSANLTPASGRQDHTTSPSASKRPRLKRHLRPPHPASRP